MVLLMFLCKEKFVFFFKYLNCLYQRGFGAYLYKSCKNLLEANYVSINVVPKCTYICLLNRQTKKE